MMPFFSNMSTNALNTSKLHFPTVTLCLRPSWTTSSNLIYMRRPSCAHEVVVALLDGRDDHAVAQRVLELESGLRGQGGLGLEGRHFASELRAALLRKAVRRAVLHPVGLVEHAEQRGQVELARVDATEQRRRAAYGRFWYSKRE